MTSAEYNRFADLLHYGHEVDFIYNGKRYFLERSNKHEYELYDMTDESNAMLLCKITAHNNNLVSLFLNEPIFNGKSFNEIYSLIEQYYID